MKLSENLTLSECTKSLTAIRKGINNSPSKEHLVNLTILANKIFQPIRDHFKEPIFISSGYRSPELNEEIGGSETSFHSFGRALDLDQDDRGTSVQNEDIFYFIYKELEYSELIWEHGDANRPAWVHVAFELGDTTKQTLIAYKVLGEDGKPETKYAEYDETTLKNIFC